MYPVHHIEQIINNSNVLNSNSKFKLCKLCGVRACELEGWPCKHKVPSSTPGSGCQLWDFCSARVLAEFQEAESREISIGCKNLFFNRCKMNMFNLLPDNKF